MQCWRRLLRVPWTARKSKQLILKEINSEYSLEGLMLERQYFGHLMWELTHWKRPWCWERLKAGWEGDDRKWDGWMASLTQWTWVWANSRRWGRSMGSLRVRHNRVTGTTNNSQGFSKIKWQTPNHRLRKLYWTPSSISTKKSTTGHYIQTTETKDKEKNI